MTPLPNLSSSDINRLVSQARQSRPMYEGILPFFEQLFMLQEASVEKAHPAPLETTAEQLTAKQDGGMPLIDRQALSIDIPAARELLFTLCKVAQSATGELSVAAAALQRVLETTSESFDQWIAFLLREDEVALETAALEIGVKPALMHFFIYSCIWPSLKQNIHRVADHLPEDDDWNLGVCPVCGSTPALGYLTDDNKRHLICRLCRHDWVLRRVCCPYCNNTEPQQLGYFINEQEGEYRVYTCDNCHQYLKTIDLGELARTFYPPLEDLITTHLDLQAQKLGYTRQAPSLVAC